MTAPLYRDLARAAIALPGWEWRPGMLTQHAERVLVRVAGGRLLVQGPDIEHNAARVLSSDGPTIVRADDGGPRVPDYRDPATAGCLLHLLGEEAWRVACVGAAAGAFGWTVLDDPDDYAVDAVLRFFTPTLGEACIRAAIARGGWSAP